MKQRLAARVIWALIGMMASVSAFAHSVSNAYLTLNETSAHRLHGKWDIALRDLNFVLGLDNNGNGSITWKELSSHQTQITKYAYSRLQFLTEGEACQLNPTKQMVDTHADGAYAVLLFNVNCRVQVPKTITLNYRLLFNVDPSHRGILVFRACKQASTALLSPANATLKLALRQR